MTTRRSVFNWIRGLATLGLAVMLLVNGINTALAAVWTDQPDYVPGSVVTIHGDNSDDAGYRPGETVHVSVVGPNGYTAACDGVADPNGAWVCQVTLATDLSAVGEYTYTAVGQISHVSQSGMFTDGNLQFALATEDNAAPSNLVWTIYWEKFGTGNTPNTTCSGTPSSTGSGANVGIGQNQSARPTGATATGFVLTYWSSSATSTTPLTAAEICIAGTQGGGTIATLYAHFAVANTAPVVTAAANQAANEGTSTSFNLGSFSDPNGGPWSVDVDWGDGPSHTTFGMAAVGTITAQSHTYADNTTPPSTGYIVTVKVTDSTSLFDSKTFQVTVNNVAPTATLSNNGPVNEGSPATVSFSGQSDPSSADTSAGFHYAFSCTNDNLSGMMYAGSGTGDSTTCTFNDNGTYPVKARIIDKDDGFTEYTTDVVVNNVAPVVTAASDQSANEGANTSFALGSFTDPGVNDNPWVVDVDWGDGSSHITFNMATRGALTAQSHTYADNTTPASTGYIVTVKVTDKDSGSDSKTFKVTVNNVAPVVNAGDDATINEGDTFNSSGSFTDPGADTWTATVNYGDGSGIQSLSLSGKAFALSHVYADNGSYTVAVCVTDDDGGEGCDTASVTVNNVAPEVTITGPADYSVFAITSGVAVDYQWTDPGTLDTFECKVDWGDGTPATFVPCTSPQVTALHYYTSAGVWTIKVTVKDDDGGQDSATISVVVYDPSAGFVTGGGWIMSPAGAYRGNTALTGKANFGFVSKYLKGAQVPTGQTEFQFQVAGLNFHSTSYEWLVVNQNGTNAQYKGVGTINGAGSYQFMLWATDGTADTFRIKIFTVSGGVETVVYDNGFDQSIGGGSIVVHTGKK